MDLSIDLERIRLNIRSTAVIIHNNKLLVHQNKNENFCALVGGRVKIGEDSAKTIKREIFEELGKEIEITDYLTTIENFFEAENKRFHEIMFVYKAEFVNDEDKIIEYSMNNMEGNKDLTYNWIDLNEIEDKPLMPAIIRKMIKNDEFNSNRIFYDKL